MEERSVIWKVTVSVIVRKESSYELVLILGGCRGTDIRISRPLSVRSLFVRDEQRSLRKKGVYRRRTAPSHFSLWCWLQSEVYKRNVDTQHELLARILNAAACVKKREDQLRRTTGDLRTRVAKCIVADGGIYEYLL